MDRIFKVLRAFSFPRSDTDCQTPKECLKRTMSCISIIERSTSSLLFNHSLCERFVTTYIRPARDLLDQRQSEIELYSEQCAPALTALHQTLNEAEFLIQKHSTSTHWIRAAVELVENTSAFAEVILDLRWYILALQIAIEASRGTPRSRQLRHQKDLIWELQNSAMTEHGNFLESWGSECKDLKLEGDRELLLSKLKFASGAEIRCLQSYLAHKLLQKMHHAREAVAVNLNVPELLLNKVLLGEGSYGKVYKVQWLGMPCALKQLVTSDIKEVVPEEVRILSKIHHPNIIQLYCYSFDRGTLYLIMELMDDSLSEYVGTKEWTNLRSSPFFLLVALDCMLQIAKGVRYLHSKGIAHRDLKGANVLVKPIENPDRKGKGYLNVKLADFGVAKANLRNSTYSSLAVDVGSLPWKAPELFRIVKPDVSNINPKRKHYPLKPDVYSFGMVCYEILSGRKPFSNAELTVPRSEFYARVKSGELRPKLPEKILVQALGLSDYIKRCWDTDPGNRPDFVDICKRIRHFRDSLLQITAYAGWELKAQERKTVIEEPSTIDEIDFIDIPEDDWNWKIEYDDIQHEKSVHSGSGFLSVYLAQLKMTSQRVLAKHIEVTLIDNNASSIADFKHEVGLLVRIRHPNLVHYLGATTRAPFVVVTEFAQGVTLRNLFKTTTLSQQDAVYIALQIAHGMASLHEEQIVIIHGELSPDCILIDESTMTAKVADFGLRSFKKPPNKHCFSRWYRRAPEQHKDHPLRPSVDVFSFGMILYELLECEKAQLFWKKKNASKKLLEGERPELGLSECYPKGVHALIKRCWTQEWEERPSFGSIVSDLRRIDADLQKKLTLQSKSTIRSISKDRHQV